MNNEEKREKRIQKTAKHMPNKIIKNNSKKFTMHKKTSKQGYNILTNGASWKFKKTKTVFWRY